MRLISLQISKLKKNNFILLVDLTPDCTFIVCASNNGPFLFDRLASIRNYSRGGKSNNNLKDNAKKENDSSLPISKLDLKILFKEITTSLKNIAPNKSYENFSIFLTGYNSLHENIRETFEEYFKTKVAKINAFDSISLGTVDYDSSKIPENTVSKLIGLALGLNNSEELLLEENDSSLNVDKNEKIAESDIIIAPKSTRFFTNTKKV